MISGIIKVEVSVMSDKQFFTVFIKQSSAEKLNAFLKKVSLKKSVDDQTDECLASLNVFNHKKFR